jgi:hypothetical protein
MQLWSERKMAKPDLVALFDPTRDFELVEPRTIGFWLTLPSGIFVAIGVMMVLDVGYESKVKAWFALIFFGLCLAVGLFKLFGKPDTMKFDQSGFIYTSLGRVVRQEWAHVTGFGTYRVFGIIGNKMVGMNMRTDLQSPATAIAKGLAGFDGALPTSYGVKHQVLAQAMQTRMEAAHARR